MRLTSHRQEILDLLTQSGTLRSAADIHAALPHINVVTIYRALEYLTTHQLISKVFLEGDEAYYEKTTEPHHHAICTTCGAIIHFATDNQILLKDLAVPGFVGTNIEIVVRGLCTRHQSHKKQRSQTK